MYWESILYGLGIYFGCSISIVAGGYISVKYIKPLCPDWWERNISAPYPEPYFYLEDVQPKTICNRLNLNIKAGLGRRLAEAEIKLDANNPYLFYIRVKGNAVEALRLAKALSIRAEKVLLIKDMRFEAVRISCS